MASIKTDSDREALRARIGEKLIEIRRRHNVRAPEFPPGLDWFNSRPLAIPELRGKVVLLDFWTYCSVNCLHVLQDLKRLHEKYAMQPVAIIGVHSAKFTTEKESANLLHALKRYEVRHPVVADTDFQIWQAYTVRAWPTLVLIDPEGYVLGSFSGEGHGEIIDCHLEVALEIFGAESKLNRQPLALTPELEAQPESYLKYPGKVLADEGNQRLIIADTNHHRLLECQLDARVVQTIGSGEADCKDGVFTAASFHFPQGMGFYGEDLIVCDAGNHLIRRVDFRARTVTTIAGTGHLAHFGQGAGPGMKTPLNSPWDIFITGSSGYIAMAGLHQIWHIDLKTNRVHPFAGTGQKARRDGELMSAAFAQPTGVTGEVIGGQLQRLFIADSEISCIREISLSHESVRTLAGGDLFQYGDKDGIGSKVRLQHPLEVIFHQGRLYVADAYNHKIKLIDPNLNTVKTLAGDGHPGSADGEQPRFNEPGGLAVLDNRLYVADTNNHAIRTVDLKTLSVATLMLRTRE